MAEWKRPVAGLVTEPASWKGRRVLVTGHTGFKGGWLSLWLQQLGADVTGFALPHTTPKGIFVAADVESGMRSILGDVRDSVSVNAAVADADPEVVFHLAAQPLVRRSYVDPVDTFEVNVMGTANLLEALRGCESVKAVVVVTSDKCYENREWPWAYREGEALGGADPYSASKACQEHVTEAFRRSFFSSGDRIETGVATARAGNVIGGGDFGDDRLIPDVVNAFAAGLPVKIRYPDATRPWQHVLEPLAGYLLLAEALIADPSAVAFAYNFGPASGDAWPVSQIVSRMAEQWGEGASWRVDDGEHPHEAQSLRLDAAKARDELGWRPRFGPQEALDLTIEWYVAQRSDQNLRHLTLRQLADYSTGGAVTE